MGAADMDQLRSLACQGRALLAWFEGLAHPEFTPRDKCRRAPESAEFRAARRGDVVGLLA